MKNTYKRQGFQYALAIACIMFLSGCASFGSKQLTSSDIVSQIQVGQSTKSDVKKLLGEPMNVVFVDTEEDWYYSYTRSTVRPASFIPLVGIFAGGSDMQTYNLTIRFNKDGVVQNVGKGEVKGGAGSIFD
jgi:outer membrane protein assembly factor BamE (lipoprotein component of BamABCDE complex)